MSDYDPGNLSTDVDDDGHWSAVEPDRSAHLGGHGMEAVKLCLPPNAAHGCDAPPEHAVKWMTADTALYAANAHVCHLGANG